MHGVCRLLWCLILLTLVGCQLMPQGSTNPTGKLSDGLSAPARGEGLVALIAARRNADSNTTENPETPPLPGRGVENDVPQTVRDEERPAATPGQGEAQMQRLARAFEDEVGGQLTDRQRTRQADVSAPAPATDDFRADPSVEQIILTRRPDSDSRMEPTGATSSVAQPHGQPDQTRRAHPLADEPVRLASPEPEAEAGRRSSPTEPPPVTTVSQEQPVAAIFDAFGSGGESLAAQQKLAEASRIGLAGRTTIDESDTQAAVIARNLDAEKASPSVYWQEDLDKLITLLEAQIAQQKPGNTDYSRDQYIRQHVALRMLYLIASRQPEALQAIPGVSHDQQEFWTRMFWALASIFDEEAMPNSTVRAAETVAQLRAAIEQLQPRASLELRSTVFCGRIDGFGDFVTFDDGPFSPGQPVLIYTEVRNFQSQLSADGSYSTKLRSSITIQQESVSGPVVFRYDLPESEDRCQSRRRDYFHSYRIHLPETLKPGLHVLTLDVTDTLTGKNGSTTLNFVVR